jgi:CRISPR-associated protein Csb2
MIGISMTFLAGRFHATPWGHHVNEGVVEYPPSPWRLLRSLVATFHRARPEGVSAEQLTRIVDALAAPPVYRLPHAATAHTRHYDAANGGIKFFDTFLSLDPNAAVIWLWKDAELDTADRIALASLLESLGTFGRAESWCEATLLDDAKALAYFTGEAATHDMRDAAPLDAGDLLKEHEPVRVLMPNSVGAELMNALLDETAAMRKRRQLDPPGSRWMTYTRPLDLLTPRHTKISRPTHTEKVMIARFALDSNVLPLVQDTLPFCETVRWAVLKLRKAIPGAPFSEVLTGKEADEQTPLKGHAHAHYLATDENGDGRIDHITVYAARGFSPYDLEALGSLRKLYRHGETHTVFAVLVGHGDAEDFRVKDFRERKPIGDQDVATLLQPSRRWRSVTPFVLPRFATRGAGKRARPRDMPVEQLKREAHLRGLPEIIRWRSGDDIDELKGYTAKDRPLVRWLEFETRRFNGSTGYGVAGFEIEFAEEVNGPLALGFGSHFGLGLFEVLPDAA